jgi:vacuole morphology and inheritance protein 14
MTWVHEFITLGGDRLLAFYADLLRAVMHCISDNEPEIRQVAGETNQSLLVLVQGTQKPFELGPLINILTTELLSDHVPTRLASLNWISMMHQKDPEVHRLYTSELWYSCSVPENERVHHGSAACVVKNTV